MEEKKSPKASLESKKLMLIQIGLIISLALAWRVFEVKSYNKETVEEESIAQKEEEEDLVEITKQEEEVKPEPEEMPKQQAIELEVVDDDVEVKDVEINADVDLEEDISAEIPDTPDVIDDDVEEAEIFTVVEEMPSFPGGMEKLPEYLAKNIKYPQMARESGIQGRVFVYFVVEPDGSVSKVQVLRGIGGGCDEEAIRVVKNMPKWKPGKQRGKPVRVSYNLPVNFQLK